MINPGNTQLMMPKRQPENTKVCPGCGTTLIDTARHCSMCGYVFLDTEMGEPRRAPAPRRLQVTVSLPWLLLAIIALLGMNTVVMLGLQKRTETKIEVQSVNATSTYVATIYVSPTLTATATRTPAPPTPTPEPKIEYTVVSGDSCLSIASYFHISLDSLVSKNDIDCSLLKIGTVLMIPKPTATPEPLLTPGS